MHVIEIGKDFSKTPGGRRISDGPDSGQLFRDRLLAPALRNAVEQNEKLIVMLDGPRGYLSSFLEEAFGGLVRRRQFTKAQLRQHLDIRANDRFYETYRRLALRYIDEAEPELVAIAG
jgi:STAS-like domain of unknown function (DUF4325)